jgi:hypothetical protein
MMVQGMPGLGMSIFFVGRERCRLPEGLALAALARRLRGVPASISLRTAQGFVITSTGEGEFGHSEENVVEVREYDPVRHSCLAIGLTEPGIDTPVHWMAYRTDEQARAAAFVRATDCREGVGYITRRHPRGSFQEALEIAAMAKRTGGPAGAQGNGFLLKAATEMELERAVLGMKGQKGEAKQ